MKTRRWHRKDLIAFLAELEKQGVTIRKVPGGVWINRNWKSGTGDIMFGAEVDKKSDDGMWIIKWDNYFEAAMEKITDAALAKQSDTKADIWKMMLKITH